eukprot:6183835-Pleurochrysis_carterae.AAC.2
MAVCACAYVRNASRRRSEFYARRAAQHAHAHAFARACAHLYASTQHLQRGVLLCTCGAAEPPRRVVAWQRESQRRSPLRARGPSAAPAAAAAAAASHAPSPVVACAAPLHPRAAGARAAGA